MNFNGIQKECKRSDKSIRVMREQRHNFDPSNFIFFAEFLIVAMVLASGEGDLPDADQVVGVTGEERLSIGGPGEGGAGRSLGFGGSGQNFWFQLVDDDLAFQIPDFDGCSGGGAEPVSVGREGEGVDGVASVESVEMLSLVEIPEHRLAVLATGSAEGTVGRDGDRVQVTGVADVVRLQLAVGQIPNLDEFVPSGGDDDGVGVGWRETDAGDPFGMSFLLDGVFADAESVPQFDGAIAGAGDDLSVVSGEGDAEDVLSVSDESPRRRSHRQVPQTQSRIPRAGQSELPIRGQNDVGHEVSVALESLVGDTVVSVILGQLPDDDRLVTRRRKNHVREHGSGRNLRNPPIVSLQSSAKSQLFRHGLLLMFLCTSKEKF